MPTYFPCRRILNRAVVCAPHVLNIFRLYVELTRINILLLWLDVKTWAYT